MNDLSSANTEGLIATEEAHCNLSDILLGKPSFLPFSSADRVVLDVGCIDTSRTIVSRGSWPIRNLGRRSSGGPSPI